MEKVTWRDIISRSIGHYLYDNRSGLEKLNAYDFADRILSDIEKTGIPMTNFEAVYRNGDFYVKQLDGRYYSVNSLKYIDKL